MYLAATYYIRPNGTACTSQKNFFSNPANLALDESITLVRNLRYSDLTKANVILDLQKKELVKNRSYRIDKELVPEATYETLYKHFHGIYPKELDAAVLIGELESKLEE